MSTGTLGIMDTQTSRLITPRRCRPAIITTFIYALLLICFIPIASSAEQNPETVVTTASRNIVNALQKHHDELVTHPEKLYSLIENIVIPHFDVKAITRLVLGPQWRQATPEQRQRFTDAFKLLVINSYAKALLVHSNDDIQVQPVRSSEQGSNRVSIHSVVKADNGKVISIDYRLRRKDGGWKIYDFTIEGMSLILNYKHSFSAQIQKKGLDGLIKSIDEKNANFRL